MIIHSDKTKRAGKALFCYEEYFPFVPDSMEGLE